MLKAYAIISIYFYNTLIFSYSLYNVNFRMSDFSDDEEFMAAFSESQQKEATEPQNKEKNEPIARNWRCLQGIYYYSAYVAYIFEIVEYSEPVQSAK